MKNYFIIEPAEDGGFFINEFTKEGLEEELKDNHNIKEFLSHRDLVEEVEKEKCITVKYLKPCKIIIKGEIIVPKM